MSDSSKQSACVSCGGIHYGSGPMCPYEATVCDKCHKTLLQHEGFFFCEGGATEHDPRNKFCTCAACITVRKPDKPTLSQLSLDIVKAVFARVSSGSWNRHLLRLNEPEAAAKVRGMIERFLEER